MKKVLNIAILLAFSSLLLFGCGGGQQVVSKGDVGAIPEWFDNPPKDPNYIFEVGTGSSKDLQLARDKAADAARMNIGKTIETRFKGFSKRFQEEVGIGAESEYLDQFTQATKAVVSMTLRGVEVERTKTVPEKGLYRVFIMMKYPLGAASEALMNKLKQQEHLYTRFKASKAFDELEEEVEQYEEYKKEQGW